jgi:hypothetical protein
MIEADESIDRQRGEDGMITAIPKNKAKELLEVIRNGIDRDREVYRHQQQKHEPLSQAEQPISIADKLTKLAKLKEQGIISEDEFQQMKQSLIWKKPLQN